MSDRYGLAPQFIFPGTQLRVRGAMACWPVYTRMTSMPAVVSFSRSSLSILSSVITV